jgi:hypothetical protein
MRTVQHVREQDRCHRASARVRRSRRGAERGGEGSKGLRGDGQHGERCPGDPGVGFAVRMERTSV